ncbi:MAG: 5'-nucleotidase C-terminal domain-containing protein [Clostridium sp.]|uniref:5'-nucleotidase C-terminal domain-containing protein n=1 Tax=Clostridium sp. TaxID=1506 RepID=UPI00303EA1C4
MIVKKRLTAFMTALALLITMVMPANTIKVYADDNQKVNATLAEADKSEKTTIQVLSTTDLHGKFKNYDYATMSSAVGGLNQIATIVKEETAKNPNTIVVDNGDTIQGNYNHLFLKEEYLNKNTNPMILGMNTIGYDSFSLGNHEFNYGMKVLNKIAEQSKAGGTDVLCANLYKDGKRVFDPYTIKEFGGIKVATIGVVTNNITRWDADKLVGYEPTRPDEEVKKVISEIKAGEGADIFIVTSHMGLTSEYGNGDSATDIANLNPELAMIVAGHSHTTIQNQTVNGVLITQPTNGGQGVSKAILEVEKTDSGFKVVNKTSSVIKLTKESAVDENLNTKLQIYHDIAVADATSAIGKLVGENLANNDEVNGIPESFVTDQGVTDLINQVQLYYSDKQLASIGVDPSKVYHVSGAAMLSAASNLKAGAITKADLANIYKFDNKLYTIKTTGKQIKKYLEWTADVYNTFEEGDFTVSFNDKFASYKYDMLSGVKYEINISKPLGYRIENLYFNDDKKVEDIDVVYLTVNDYRYNSNLAKIFDEGQHSKIYESTNDPLSDIRDMIANYIVEVKSGEITRNVDNNWHLTGIKYNEKLRNEVVKLINNATIEPVVNYGMVAKPLTWNDVVLQLTQKGEMTKLAELRKLTKNTVDILSFNDFHGNVLESGKNIGAAKLAGVVNKYNSKENDMYGVIPVAAGDLYQGTAISNLTIGQPVTAMLKSMGLEGAAIGNHEFDWGVDNINTWSEQGGFKFLAANIVNKGTQDIVSYAEPYKIVEKNGAKIALIGISTPETASSTLAENVKNVEFLDPVETVDKYSKIVRDKENVDAVVVIAHCGAYQDSKTKVITGEAADIARVDGVDAVIAGHNHAVVSGKVDGVPVVEGGYNGRGLAKLTFTFDDNNKLLNVEPYVHVFQGIEGTLPVDKEVETLVNKIQDDLKGILGEKVTVLEERLSHDDKNTAVTPLGVTVAETMRNIVGTQIGVTNGGGVRRSLEKGDVTVGDMYEILPFDNTIVKLDVTGSDLYSIIEHGINTNGFAWGQFAGIKVWYDKETGKVSSIRLNDGSKIEAGKYYSVAINDFMLTGGDKYDFSKAENVVNTNIVMRDAMAENWKVNGVPNIDFEVLVVGEDTTIDNTVPENPDTDGNPNKPSELPQTGIPLTADMIAIMSIALGGCIIKRKKSA